MRLVGGAVGKREQIVDVAVRDGDVAVGVEAVFAVVDVHPVDVEVAVADTGVAAAPGSVSAVNLDIPHGEAGVGRVAGTVLHCYALGLGVFDGYPHGLNDDAAVDVFAADDFAVGGHDQVAVHRGEGGSRGYAGATGVMKRRIRWAPARRSFSAWRARCAEHQSSR